MRVYELIAELKKMPPSSVVKINDGEYVSDIRKIVYQDGREFTVITSDEDL